jgi:HD-GYP domain-containing protein (c-di-GMP phosphodiesterase class II)
MANRVLREIDFARYRRWLNRAVGADVSFMIFDNTGEALSGDDSPWAAGLGRAIAATGQGATGARRLDLMSADKTALYQPLGFTKDGLLGWAALVIDRVEEGKASIDLDRLAETMDDLVAGIFDEYSHRSDLELMTEELGARYEELHLVYAVDRHVQEHATEHEGVFQSLLESAAEHLNVDVVAFVRPSKNICLYAASLSKEIHNLDLVLVEMRGDLFRFVQSSRETVVLNALDDPRRAYIFTDMPYKVIACPVRSDQRVDALVVLLNHAHKPNFTNSDRKLAEVLANQLSSLSNTYLLLASMREFNQQMAQALIEAVEAKDPYTRGHSERVNFLSMEIGKAMGLSTTELDDLHWGSLLHDVGKIGIPDAVLCKPSKLTKDEYTFIMVHPERSYEILRHIRHLENAVPGARHHQERFDGTGYPHGLKGERIPLHARIMAVADTYDSITSSRAYRAGRTHEAAMTELDKVAGTQLDPSMVEVFKNIVATEPEWLRRFNIRRDKA